MTLHWWMHWFWVTALLTIQASGGQTAAVPQPQSEELQYITTDLGEKHSERQSRAMYFPKPASTSARPPPLNVTEENFLEVISKNDSVAEAVLNATQWTAVETTDMNLTKIYQEPPKINNVTNINTTEAVTTVNPTETLNTTKKRNLTRPDFVKDDSSIESALESRIVTDKPLSLETTYLQTRIPPNIELYRRVESSEGGMDTGAIAGISFAALVLAALAGSTAFVLYRRRYLNKPQTLNDKCSNPDSSGYLDDSTIRDNSEEMYSLDNDSFLNSLEAMTIQNYWTDTVKHTKL
ncbi:uncharacterized protein LOC113230114 [Hyposmocoma kahamanoa]|uniref:uncharacterized protein LOC113230114 n=1 Tax=Hyposmocoma kahamanoa TaxID=1477025 RepID=UPI000E6D97D3|nr:uncharacterized protein LOC113230114 [Hyposmocoma kahamanoa]